eukprot:15441026-Alexandrium_andersonii.AAC.1
MANWEEQSAVMRDQWGVSPDSCPWTRSSGVRLVGVPQSPRVLDLLGTAWLERLVKDRAKRAKTGAPAPTAADLAKGYFVNLSQQVGRKPWGPIRCLTQVSEVYSFEHDCVLGPECNMAMQ